jgi:hypothetical protein
MISSLRHLIVSSFESNTMTHTVDVNLGTRHEHLTSRLLTRPLGGGGINSLVARRTCRVPHREISL